MASSTFSEYKVPELQDFLKVKGISVSSLKKQHLIKLCEAVKLLDLPDDPDMCREKLDTVEAMLQKYGINYPFYIQGLSNNLSELPTFSLYDVFNYLLYKTSNYDHRKLRAYKSCEDYRLFYDGYVEHLEMKEHGEICVVKSCVKPTQKDKTYLNKTVYDVWVIMGKLSGDVKTAYCTCIGGVDGGCRHIGATLYEIEALEVESVTDGDNLWLKRPRHHDCPVPIKQLKIMKARYSSVSHQDQPHHVQDFDPRTTDQRNCYSEAKLLEIATELRKKARRFCEKIFFGMSVAVGSLFIIYIYCLYYPEGHPLPFRLSYHIKADKTAEDNNLGMSEGDVDAFDDIQQSFSVARPSSLSLILKHRLLSDIDDIIQRYMPKDGIENIMKEEKKNTQSKEMLVPGYRSLRQNYVRGSSERCAVCTRCEDNNHHALSIECFEECRTGTQGRASQVCLALVNK